LILLKTLLLCLWTAGYFLKEKVNFELLFFIILLAIHVLEYNYVHYPAGTCYKQF
jgi:hypothetical protein